MAARNVVSGAPRRSERIKSQPVPAKAPAAQANTSAKRSVTKSKKITPSKTKTAGVKKAPTPKKKATGPMKASVKKTAGANKTTSAKKGSASAKKSSVETTVKDVVEKGAEVAEDMYRGAKNIIGEYMNNNHRKSPGPRR